MSADLIEEIEQLFNKSKFEEARKRFSDYSNVNSENLDKELLNKLFTKTCHWLQENSIAELYSLRGLIHASLIRYKKAIIDYNRALKLNPEYVATYHNRGIAHYNIQDYEEAMLDYNSALKLNPENASNYNSRGIVHSILNNFDKAMLDYNRAISLDPEAQNAYFNRSIIFDKLEQYLDQIKDLDEVIKLNPNKEFAFFNKATALVNLGKDKFPEAIKVFEQFILISNNEYYIEMEFLRKTGQIS